MVIGGSAESFLVEALSGFEDEGRLVVGILNRVSE
jgi:hypothetical protein